MADESVIPFYCGTQYGDWTMNNCDSCTKAAPPEASLDEMPCEIERALVWACLDDGRIPLPIADRMGRGGDRYTWPCREHDPPFMNVKPDGTVDRGVKKPGGAGEGDDANESDFGRADGGGPSGFEGCQGGGN
jgi:hypothetical protein